MLKRGEYIRIFLICLLSLSIVVLFIDMLNILPFYDKIFKLLLFISSIIFTIYFLSKFRLDQTLTFIIILGLLNPYYPISLDNPIWVILEIPILCLFIHRLYFLIFENQFQMIEQDADKLDQYLKELEHAISSLTYHQISVYIKRKHPDSAKINEDNITWTNHDLPQVKFEILMEFYSLGKNSKGGVNAKMIGKYNNIEIHLNFNLTDTVKFTITTGKGSQKPDRVSKLFKNVLIKKFYYLEL